MCKVKFERFFIDTVPENQLCFSPFDLEFCHMNNLTNRHKSVKDGVTEIRADSENLYFLLTNEAVKLRERQESENVLEILKNRSIVSITLENTENKIKYKYFTPLTSDKDKKNEYQKVESCDRGIQVSIGSKRLKK